MLCVPRTCDIRCVVVRTRTKPGSPRFRPIDFPHIGKLANTSMRVPAPCSLRLLNHHSAPNHHRSHFGSRYKLGCCGHAGLYLHGSNPMLYVLLLESKYSIAKGGSKGRIRFNRFVGPCKRRPCYPHAAWSICRCAAGFQTAKMCRLAACWEVEA